MKRILTISFILLIPWVVVSQPLNLSTPRSLVLMSLSAHPDDEDGATLVYYSKLFGVKVYSVFFTRGEGGQNEIGSELGKDLGRLRTNETLEASAILGTEAHFLDLPDFGFSKTAEETFSKWGGKEEAVARLVYVIRALKPDVIITNHDTITTLPNREHGHHQAVGISAFEAFDKAADSSFHPEQFREPSIRPWQVKKLYFHISLSDTNSQSAEIDGTRKDQTGSTMLQIAFDSYAHHRSQGMDKIVRNKPPASLWYHFFALMRSDSNYAFSRHDLFSDIQPFHRTASSLPIETIEPSPAFAISVSPKYSPLARQDEKNTFQLHRKFSVTLTNRTAKEFSADVSVISDSKQLFYKSYQVTNETLSDYVNLTLENSSTSKTQSLHFNALPGPDAPSEVKQASTTATLKRVDAHWNKNISIGLVKTYDNTTEDILNSFGIKYKLLDSTTLAKGDLNKFTTIILDLRTYFYRANAVQFNSRLMDYVRKGGNIVCLYHKPEDWNGKQLSPYPLTLTSSRVTEEDAPITELLPDHPLLHTPNVIQPSDWNNWVQERNVYLPSDDTTQTSFHYARLLSMSDSKEHQPSTSLLWTRYGKGTYTYTSLALYRQLRILHEGAVRLFFNLISQSRQSSK